jgi:hypothetical protein
MAISCVGAVHGSHFNISSVGRNPGGCRGCMEVGEILVSEERNCRCYRIWVSEGRGWGFKIEGRGGEASVGLLPTLICTNCVPFSVFWWTLCRF